MNFLNGWSWASANWFQGPTPRKTVIAWGLKQSARFIRTEKRFKINLFAFFMLCLNVMWICTHTFKSSWNVIMNIVTFIATFKLSCEPNVGKAQCKKVDLKVPMFRNYFHESFLCWGVNLRDYPLRSYKIGT